jgi:hypothetical protein
MPHTGVLPRPLLCVACGERRITIHHRRMAENARRPRSSAGVAILGEAARPRASGARQLSRAGRALAACLTSSTSVDRTGCRSGQDCSDDLRHAGVDRAGAPTQRQLALPGQLPRPPVHSTRDVPMSTPPKPCLTSAVRAVSREERLPPPSPAVHSASLTIYHGLPLRRRSRKRIRSRRLALSGVLQAESQLAGGCQRVFM